MKLLIDLGNSRCKWALVLTDAIMPAWSANGIWENSGYSEKHWLKSLSTIKTHLENDVQKTVSAIYISSVSSDLIQQKVSHYVQQVFALVPQFLKSQKRYITKTQTLMNSYDKPTALGIDRWLVMVAAIEQFDNGFAVLDAGTAITLDCVDASGEHLGGHIVPGVGLMAKGLFNNTGKIAFGANLDATEADGNQWLGVNSQQAVSLGCEAAAIGYLERVLSDLSSKSAIRDFIVCGGDGAELVKQCDTGDFNIHLIEDLVLQGLFHSARIYGINDAH